MAVRIAVPADVGAMVRLSAAKRAAYARVQPVFWRPAANADERQRAFFEGLVTRSHTIALIAEEDGAAVGFVIGELRAAPPVYDPGGATLVVDDFCVEVDRWGDVGSALLGDLRRSAAARGAVQLVVVCGAHDRGKSDLIARLGLTAASTWYLGST
jgi:ribosomal protein S18 acetylase RimI-like enzyme